MEGFSRRMLAVVGPATLLSACGDVPTAEERYQQIAMEASATHWEGCNHYAFDGDECSDRELNDAAGEWSILRDRIDSLCPEAVVALDPFWADLDFRIRDDFFAPQGDWHWGEGIHLSGSFWGHSVHTQRWQLAHEAYHEICFCGGTAEFEQDANDFADSCAAW